MSRARRKGIGRQLTSKDRIHRAAYLLSKNFDKMTAMEIYNKMFDTDPVAKKNVMFRSVVMECSSSPAFERVGDRPNASCMNKHPVKEYRYVGEVWE